MKNAREDILDIQVRTGDFYLKDLMEKVLATYAEKCRVRMVDLMIASYENRLLKGDLERAVEVFENLFENAFKYGDGRSIRITFYEEDYCQLIRIYNTGDPVTDNEFNHIFESFFALQTVTVSREMDWDYISAGRSCGKWAEKFLRKRMRRGWRSFWFFDELQMKY